MSEAKPSPTPLDAALQAGLRYVNDNIPGYRRKRWGQGFTYLDPDGERVQDPELRQRFEALVIPPAWTEVWICPDLNGHIQVTGRDDKGRKQYIYHPQWDELRNLSKFNRMAEFGSALPALRQQVDADLRRRSLSREKVLAIVVRLLETTLIRIGNHEYARRNGSYGLTTLQDDHLDVSGGQLSFTFIGKRGKHQTVGLRHRRLARMVKACQDLPGQQLFQYLDENGECCQAVDSSDVNAYLKAITGKDFTAKDFRTWGATLLSALELYDHGPAETEKEVQKKMVQVVKTTAQALGNTPTICRAYYIHPKIFEAYQDGSLFRVMGEFLAEGNAEFGLEPEERAVIALLG
jgi:DNA topoisomerase I